MDIPPGSEGASPPKTSLNGHIKPTNRSRSPLPGTPREKADDIGPGIQAAPQMYRGTEGADQPVENDIVASSVDATSSSTERQRVAKALHDQVKDSRSDDTWDPEVNALSLLGTDEPGQAAKDHVTASFGGDHSLSGKQAISNELGDVINDTKEVRVRQRSERNNSSPTRESIAGEREHVLQKHETLVYAGMLAAIVLGMAIACNSLAAFISESTLVDALTDHFGRALLMSGIGFTGAVLLKAGAELSTNERTQRIYHNRVFGVALVSTTIYVLVLSLAFAPHKTDLAQMQATLAGGGVPETPFADAIRAIANYALVGTQLITEMTGAPIIFFAMTRRHLMGRKIHVVSGDAWDFHQRLVEASDQKIMHLVMKKGECDDRIRICLAKEAERIEAVQRAHRRLEADRARYLAQADEEFQSTRKGRS
jgi:hypothetical protein